MSLRWQASLDPPVPLVDRLSNLYPTNPFCTPQFAAARQRLGERVCVLGLGAGDNLVSGCLGFIRGKWARCRLQIASMPILPEGEVFWRGLRQLCRESGIWLLQVESYASPGAVIPSLPGEIGRRQRVEYILDLQAVDPLNGASPNHRRNIARGASAGLAIRRTRNPELCATHLAVMEASLQRRANRGEDIEFDSNVSSVATLLTSQAGELFQVLEGDQIVSSLLVLRSRSGAYYQSAGTSLRGMEVGASPFLISQVARMLQQEGTQVFNLGGAGPEGPGLQRFKAGFGARKVELMAASFCPQPRLQRGLYAVLRALREKQRTALGILDSQKSTPAAEKRMLALSAQVSAGTHESFAMSFLTPTVGVDASQ
jgi:hypothetical protein